MSNQGCNVLRDCVGDGQRRLCGHLACDDHTDFETGLCMWCVPVDATDYADAVTMAQEATEHGRTA